MGGKWKEGRGREGEEGERKGEAGEYVHSPMISLGRAPLDKIYRWKGEKRGGGREAERERERVDKAHSKRSNCLS